VAQASQTIYKVLGENTVSERTAQNYFKKFSSDDEIFEGNS